MCIGGFQGWGPWVTAGGSAARLRVSARTTAGYGRRMYILWLCSNAHAPRVHVREYAHPNHLVRAGTAFQIRSCGPAAQAKAGSAGPRGQENCAVRGGGSGSEGEEREQTPSTQKQKKARCTLDLRAYTTHIQPTLCI